MLTIENSILVVIDIQNSLARVMHEKNALFENLQKIIKGATIICVYQTTVDLIHAGYEVHIVTDCTSSRTEENRALGIERMINEGAKPTSTEMALFELLKIAEDERFREISRLVK